MKTIEDIMNKVGAYGHAVVALDNAKSNGDIQKALAVADSAHKAIESALRELVEQTFHQGFEDGCESMEEDQSWS